MMNNIIYHLRKVNLKMVILKELDFRNPEVLKANLVYMKLKAQSTETLDLKFKNCIYYRGCIFHSTS